MMHDGDKKISALAKDAIEGKAGAIDLLIVRLPEGLLDGVDPIDLAKRIVGEPGMAAELDGEDEAPSDGPSVPMEDEPAYEDGEDGGKEPSSLADAVPEGVSPADFAKSILAAEKAEIVVCDAEYADDLKMMARG